jgi:hypothetical protein
MANANKVEAVSVLDSIRKSWLKHYVRWNWTHRISAILTLSASISVASKPQFISTVLSSEHAEVFDGLLAWMVAILTGLTGLLRPAEVASKSRSAWTLLTIALTRYKADEAYTVDHVLAAYEEGERIMHETSQQSPTSQKP